MLTFYPLFAEMIISTVVLKFLCVHCWLLRLRTTKVKFLSGCIMVAFS